MIELLLLAGLNAKGCLPPEDIVEKRKSSVVQILISDKQGRMATGTGLVVNKFGDVITSTHVIDTAESIVVRDTTGEQYAYRVKKLGGEDSVSSLMPSTVKKPVSYAFSYATNLVVGEPLYTLGHPLGLHQLFSAGHLSGFKDQYVMTDIPVYPGMSGSPVFDCKGAVAGFVLAYIAAPTLGVLNHVNDVKEVL